MHMNVFLYRVVELSAACFVSIGCVKVTAECAQTKDTNGFQRAFNPHRLGQELFTLVSFTLEPLGGSRKFVKHVLCRTQIKIPRLLAF